MDRQALQRLLKGLGGGPRLAILAFLKRRRSAAVGDTARAVHRSQNTASIHLSHLEHLGIVARRRRGRWVTYRLAVSQNPVARQVLKAL